MWVFHVNERETVGRLNVVHMLASTTICGKFEYVDASLTPLGWKWVENDHKHI